MSSVANGTQRKCSIGDHKIAFDAITPPGGHWYHQKREDWIDQPHKASPKRYKRNNAEEVPNMPQGTTT